MPPFRNSAEIPRSIEELDAQHQLEMDKARRGYLDAMSQVAGTYSGLLDGVLRYPNTTDLEDALSWPEKSVANITRTHSEAILSQIYSSSELARQLLTPGDQIVLSEYEHEIARYGIGSAVAELVLRKAGSASGQRGIRMAVDGMVWRMAERDVQNYGPTSAVVELGLTRASSLASKYAMKVMLDQYVLQAAKQNAQTYGFASAVVSVGLGGASNPGVSEVIRLALDSIGWEELQDNAQNYGPNSPVTTIALSKIFHEKARSLMGQLLGTTHNAQRQESARTNDTQRQNTTPPPRPKAPPTPRPQPRPQPKVNEKRQEAERIAREVAAQDRKFGWLASEDPGNILRVINTVRKLREQAAQTGTEISDFQVYVRFRRKIETSDPSDQLKRSFSILDAMMGGKPKGKLPF